jgi:hypothetical protein
MQSLRPTSQYELLSKFHGQYDTSRPVLSMDRQQLLVGWKTRSDQAKEAVTKAAKWPKLTLNKHNFFISDQILGKNGSVSSRMELFQWFQEYQIVRWVEVSSSVHDH